MVHRVAFLDRSTVDATFREPSFDHQWLEWNETSRDAVCERLEGATIAIVNKVPIGEEQLASNTSLRLVAVAATGVDNIDVERCTERGIAVCNVRGYATEAVVEHAFMLMLALRRNLLAYRESVREGAWQRASTFSLACHSIEDLAGATLGIVGAGAIGRAMARVGAAFGMRVLLAEHKGSASVRVDRTPFLGVLKESDVVTLHAPLDDSTRHMIGEFELGCMKRSAILVNTSRGALVDEAALVDAVLGERILGVAVDVLSLEPPRDGNPLLAVERPNVIVTPHIAWASRGARQRLADLVVDNLEAFVRGAPVNVVNPAYQIAIE